MVRAALGRYAMHSVNVLQVAPQYVRERTAARTAVGGPAECVHSGKFVTCSEYVRQTALRVVSASNVVMTVAVVLAGHVR